MKSTDLALYHTKQRNKLERIQRQRTLGSRRVGGNGRSLDKVFNYIVGHIRNGNFAPGMRLTERFLARQLNVSHVPVREALEKLLQHGWVERIPKKGTYVRNRNGHDITETYKLREIIECGAARVAAEHVSSDQLERLRAVVDLLEDAYESNNAEVFKEADIEFHRLVVHCAGSDRLDNMFDSIVLQAHCFFFIGASGASTYAEKAHEELQPVSHALILEAIAAHDGTKAEELVRQHIRVGCKMIMELRSILEQ